MKSVGTYVFKCPKCGKEYTITVTTKIGLFSKKCTGVDEEGNQYRTNIVAPAFVCPKCGVTMKNMSV